MKSYESRGYIRFIVIGKLTEGEQREGERRKEEGKSGEGMCVEGGRDLEKKNKRHNNVIHAKL